jgi:hypothetical protein
VTREEVIAALVNERFGAPPRLRPPVVRRELLGESSLGSLGVLVVGIDGVDVLSTEAPDVLAAVSGDPGDLGLHASVDEDGLDDGLGEVGAPAVERLNGAAVGPSCLDERVITHGSSVADAMWPSKVAPEA